MDRHIIVKLSLAQCLTSNNNNNIYRNDTSFKHTSQMGARLLKSDIQHILKKKMGEGRLAAWISNVRFSAGNENSYLAPEANCSFSEWVYVNDTDRKWNISFWSLKLLIWVWYVFFKSFLMKWNWCISVSSCEIIIIRNSNLKEEL